MCESFVVVKERQFLQLFSLKNDHIVDFIGSLHWVGYRPMFCAKRPHILRDDLPIVVIKREQHSLISDIIHGDQGDFIAHVRRDRGRGIKHHIFDKEQKTVLLLGRGIGDVK
eukprot:GEMP01045826.1.p2 GENE.GEMP01045826.1~~GEMP01045826.1.p2  ORF type:complete len:112 (-),score=13.48 GEMP01045826.1:67-402(-)